MPLTTTICWVGENSDIPNINGYRTDVFNALKELRVPVLRWPGGCFADEYHWMDGIGPKENRPKMVNNNWGGTIEDNSFGTHEFLNLCEMLGCEPYISGNVGSGTVEELAKWVEYMTSEGDSPMARLRRQNGRDKAWKVKYMGLAVLPSRLKQELFDLADLLVARAPTAGYPEALQKHAEWAQDILDRHPELNADNVHLILQDEVGHVFAEVLADAGVYKLDEAGRAGFERFLASI